MFHQDPQLPNYPHLHQYPSVGLSKRIAANPEIYRRIDIIISYYNKNDSEGLRQAFPAFNVFYQGTTVIQELAFTGQHDLVNWLIGTSLSGNRNAAVVGYVVGGYESEADALIKKGVHFKYKILGLAIKNDLAAVNIELEKSGNRQFYLKVAILGFASIANKNVVETLMKECGYTQEAIVGYAHGGHHLHVAELLARGFSVNAAVKEYALQGDIDRVESLLKLGGSLSAAVQGYASGGHREFLDSWIETGKYKNNLSFYKDCLTGYALGRHIHMVALILKEKKELLTPTTLLANAMLMKQYAIVGCTDLINQTLVVPDMASEMNLEAIVEGYAAAGYVDEANKYPLYSRFAAASYARTGNLVSLEPYFNGEFATRKKELLAILATNGRIQELNALLSDDASDIVTINACVGGFLNQNLIKQHTEHLRYTFTMISNDHLRKALFDKLKVGIEEYELSVPSDAAASSQTPSITSRNLLAIYDSSTTIRQTMQRLNLTYRQVSVIILHKNARDLILYSLEWQYENQFMANDNYYQIIENVTGLSRQDIHIIFRALCVDERDSKIAAASLDGKVDFNKAQAKINNRYLNRSRLFSESATSSMTQAAAAAAPAQPDGSASAAARM